MAPFSVVPGPVVSGILGASHAAILDIVARTYLAHEQGQSVNPDSYFLRFPDKPDARVIALPSYLGGDVDAIGIKWIASFPGNIARGLPRASAVLLLNDYATGYPLACLEAAGISAARTAASAAIAARALAPGAGPVSAAFVGAGVIARTVLDYLTAHGVALSDVLVHDLDAASAGHLVRHAGQRLGVPGAVGSLEQALARDLVVFATTAATPYVPAGTLLRPGQLLLNISLRDLAPEVLLGCDNVVDDVDHCLKAQTSPHLAEQLTGGREFVTGTLGGVLAGEVVPDPARPTVFSPFGLGILDLAVGHHVLREARRRGATVEIAEFFGETARW
ncbi:2,3-diaminopropionate biosynthesis protein SbnB [Streptomyces roseirectus]|uniref:2,3-diaminopropionate biosynthesis protein SbnB n=1 Tax=Streptomyces roseirectus TaxID=2768066 RepID=UPI00248374DE|nr:2,3-diaminopropionate biosynthesis protein SbnB [Streptomyces roseirectus]